ncbi:hypothetical protein niasHT_011864 [Heterodera trifolii]|uniref:1-alkyl-2-acetylglycerophosphocholine esterase n=1 Tax=Heterodera trifolii TaxID=157864 RepID=A0ABD2KU59_9BILA
MGLLPSKTTPSPSPSPPLNGTTPSPPTPPDGRTSAPPNGTTPSPPTPPNGTTSAPSNGTTPSPPTPPDGTTSAPPNGTTPSPPTPPNGTTSAPSNGTTPSPPTPPDGTTSAPPNGTTPSPPTPPGGTTSAPPNGTTPSPPTPPHDTTPSPPAVTTPSPPAVTTPSPPAVTTPSPPAVTTPSPPSPPAVTTPSPPSPPAVTTPSPPSPPAVTTPSPPTVTTPLPPPPPVGNVLPLLANGPHAVGCADIMLSEPSAASSSSADGVGLFARLFYPAASSVVLPTDPSTSSATMTPPALMRWRPDYDYVLGLAKYQGMSMVKMNFFLDWIVGDKKSPVHWHAPVVPGEQRFPLVIFSHGISGSRFVYTTVCASLASNGYVVAALEHRDGSCCWTYTLEPVPAPTPPPSPPLPTAVEGTPQQQNGPVPIVVVAGAENTPPQTPTPPPPVPTTTHVKKPMEMRILPHDETEYETRIDQVKRRVAETVHMRRILAEMDANLLQNAATDDNNDRQFGQQQILLGQTFDWTQFKNRLALDRCVCMGHSFGAASSLSACAEYLSLFNACVLLDAWLYPVERRMYPATVQPVLMLNASKWQWPRNVRRMQRLLSTETTTTKPPQQSQDGKSITTTATTEANAPPSVTNTDSRMMFTIKDIVHQSFSDFGFLVPGRVARYIGVQGDLDPLLTGTAVLEMVLQFLEAQFLHQQQQKEEEDEDDEEEEDESEEEEKEEEGEKESNERGGGEERNEKGEQQDEVAKSNASALDRLRRLVAEKYATFVVEGTDIPQAKLDEVAPLVEAEQQQAVAAEEERRVANDSGVDTPPTEEEAPENNNQPSS